MRNVPQGWSFNLFRNSLALVIFDRLFLLGIVGLLAGVFAAYFSPVGSPVLALSLLAFAFASIKWIRLWPVFFLLCGVVVGQARGSPIVRGFDELALLEGQKVRVEASINNDPVYHESGQFEFFVDSLDIGGKKYDALVKVRSYANDVRRGDRVELTGKLRDGFAYWQASMYYAETNLLDRDTSLLARGRAKFIAAIYSSTPDPQGSLGLGFLIGVRSLLPDNLKEGLRITGLTHIVAVSGYNLTILANASKKTLHRFSRFQAAVLTLGLLAAFVTITGLSPSILRAVVVSVLSIGGWYYGVRLSPWRLLLYSSAASALYNPSYAWLHVGWHLSLSAFFGVLVVAPRALAVIHKKKEPRILSQIFAETTSA